jgi:hypothetical protein
LCVCCVHSLCAQLPDRAVCDTIIADSLARRAHCPMFATNLSEGTGFATLSFGAERDFQIKDEASNEVRTILHKDGFRDEGQFQRPEEP